MGKKFGASLKTPSEYQKKRKRKYAEWQKRRQDLQSFKETFGSFKPLDGDSKVLPSLSESLLYEMKGSTRYEEPNFRIVRKEDPTVVYDVTKRRNWMHKLRDEAQQDCWLEDYRQPDPDLTLNWGLLGARVSIGSESE